MFLHIPELNKSDNGSPMEHTNTFLFSCSLSLMLKIECCPSFLISILSFNFDIFFLLYFYFPCLSVHLPTLSAHQLPFVVFVPSDPGAVVETHSAVPYAVIGGVLALLVFTVICVLIVTIWCSVRQKGNTQTHVANNTGSFDAFIIYLMDSFY